MTFSTPSKTTTITCGPIETLLIRHRTAILDLNTAVGERVTALNRRTENGGRRALDDVPTTKPMPARASRCSRVATCRRRWSCRPSVRAASLSGPSLNLMVETPAGSLRTSRVTMPRRRLAPPPPARTASAGQAVATPHWVNQAFLNSLASQLYSPITTTQPIKVGNQVFPPGTYRSRNQHRPRFTARPSGRHSSGIIRSWCLAFPTSRHDPHFQRWPGRDIEPVLLGARPGLALPAGGSDCDANNRGSGRRQGGGPDLALLGEHPPVGLGAIRPGDQRVGRREQRSACPRSWIAVPPGVPDRPWRRFGGTYSTPA